MSGFRLRSTPPSGPFKSGERVYLTRNHPHEGCSGTLVSFGPFGPPSFGWQGWLVKMDDGASAESCYARPNQINKENRRER